MAKKIFKNGNIITMNNQTEKAEAMMVNNGSITALGSNQYIETNYDGKGVKVIDLKGKTVLPGFNDGHLHLYQYALNKSKIEFSDATSVKEVQNRIIEYANNNNLKKGDWILGKGWNEEKFADSTFPTKKELDNIPLNNPILIKRTCFHVAVANSRALKLCGINKNTPDPEGGTIDRDNRGHPTGILFDEAIEMIEEKIPQKNISEIRELLKLGFKDVLSRGLTSIQTDDFFNIDNKNEVLKAYLELSRNNEIPVRVNLQMRLPKKDKIDLYSQKGIKTGYGTNNFKIGPLKLVLDGSLGARTAALIAPYSDKPDTKGTLLYTQKKINELAFHAHKKGFQLAIHAIGDRAIKTALNTFEYVNKKYPRNDPRPLLIHSQISNDILNKKMKELDVIAVIQPTFLRSDWSVIENRVGPKRIPSSYAWKKLIDTGIKVAGSSDAPIEPFDPLLGIYTAVTRKDFKGQPEKGWQKQECLSLYEAIKLFTGAPAYESFEENIKGTLSPGKLADFVLLAEDITAIKPDKIKDLEVEKTYVGGELVYQM